MLNDPGKPWQNGADESFNGKFRDECLSVEWFRSRREAKVIIESNDEGVTRRRSAPCARLAVSNLPTGGDAIPRW